MSLSQFHKIKKIVLLNSNGLLATLVPFLSIVVANEVVKNVISKAMVDINEELKGTSKGQGSHVQFTPEGKARIGKHATKCGVASIV